MRDKVLVLIYAFQLCVHKLVTSLKYNPALQPKAAGTTQIARKTVTGLTGGFFRYILKSNKQSKYHRGQFGNQM